MATQIVDKQELETAIGDVVDELVGLMVSLDSDAVNRVPYPDSWTPGQLFRHVTKSINGMAGMMAMEGKPLDRDAGERIPELKKIFLDFLHKLKSPDFIVPEHGPYEKQESIDELRQSFDKLKEATDAANLNELVSEPGLGELSKLEMLHFVWYHTQRHLHQFRKICAALTSD